MQITKEWLKERHCGIVFFDYLSVEDLIGKDVIYILEKLSERTPAWVSDAIWLIINVMDYRQYVLFAVYMARQALPIYEKRNPEDKRPEEAIEVILKYMENPSKKNKDATIAVVKAAWGSHSVIAWPALAAIKEDCREAETTFWALRDLIISDFFKQYDYNPIDRWNKHEEIDMIVHQKLSRLEDERQIKILKYGMELLNDRTNKKR